MPQAPSTRQQQEIDKLFEMMEQAIRLSVYEADDLLYMVADLIPANPTLAAAISMHAADFINAATELHSWTDIVVEAYRRALFDENYSVLYGTDYLIGNLEHMENFVTQFIRNHTLGDEGELVLAEDQKVPTTH